MQNYANVKMRLVINRIRAIALKREDCENQD